MPERAPEGGACPEQESGAAETALAAERVKSAQPAQRCEGLVATQTHFAQCPFAGRLRPQLGHRDDVFHRIALFRRLTCSMNIPATSDDAMLTAS
jgi:hypothetical protein